jgi:hypothetical protein
MATERVRCDLFAIRHNPVYKMSSNEPANNDLSAADMRAEITALAEQVANGKVDSRAMAEVKTLMKHSADVVLDCKDTARGRC